MNTPPDIELFFGRLHPMLVHLPIGLMVTLAALEVLALSRRFRGANASAGLLLALTVPAAVFTVVCGWLLSLGSGYDASLLQWHKWTGIATSAVCLMATLLYALDLKRLYRGCLFCGVGVLIVASHLGGSLTHGSDYLVRYAPGPLRAWLGHRPEPIKAAAKPGPAPASSAAFAGLVQPILNDKCTACHGPEKSKGGLRLDSFAGLAKGGKSGSVLTAGKSGQNELLRRIHLPEPDDDHMPPDGKPQLSEDDLLVLQWWIQAGASPDKSVAELNPTAAVTRILASRGGSAAPKPAAQPAPAKPSPELLAAAAKLADDLTVSVTPLSQNEPWLQCTASVAGTNFGDAELARVAKVGASLKWLDLGGTRITDLGLANLAAMPNLTRLHLERTAITDAGLTNLASLPNLEYLNLYATAVTDSGLERLRTLPHLKQVYLWETKVTSAGAQAFHDAMVDPGQIQQWQDQIEQLKAKIRDARITVDLGTQLASAPATNATPCNTVCPVSGKPVDASKTVLHDGVLVAFCCDDCKAKFQQDPKPYLAKLESLHSKEKEKGKDKETKPSP